MDRYVHETSISMGTRTDNSDIGLGKDIRVISEIITPRDIVKTYSALSGKQIKLHEVSAEAFAGMKNVPGLEELWAKCVSDVKLLRVYIADATTHSFLP